MTLCSLDKRGIEIDNGAVRVYSSLLSELESEVSRRPPFETLCPPKMEWGASDEPPDLSESLFPLSSGIL